MNTIQIEYIISDTKKEIYEFEVKGNCYYYCRIFFSYRDNKDDEWGEKWEKAHKKQKEKELNDFAKSKGYRGFEELEEYRGCHEYEILIPEIEAIYSKYYPTRNKTIHGETRYSGVHFGCNRKKNEYIPTMPKEKIEAAILKKIKKIKVIL